MKNVRGKTTMLNVAEENHHYRLSHNVVSLDVENILYSDLKKAIINYFMD